MAEHFQRPGWFTRHVLNPVVAVLTRLGISLAGSRVLEVTGRTSGEPRRGNTQWVKNLRAAPEGRLLVGRRAEDFAAVEVPDEEKPPLLRAYLQRWKWEVGVFFGGVGPDASDEELARIAPDHPAFRLQERAQQATPDR